MSIEVAVSTPAKIEDHDILTGNYSARNWPRSLHPVTLKIHLHFCELVHSWNMNPFRRDMGITGIDGFGEVNGISRFSFTSKENLDDFLDFYTLDSFVVDKTSDENFHWLTLTNKFGSKEANAFLTVYRTAINNLAIIHDERNRAAHVDGGKIGLIGVEHFSIRESHELTQIRMARQALAEGSEHNGA